MCEIFLHNAPLSIVVLASGIKILYSRVFVVLYVEGYVGVSASEEKRVNEEPFNIQVGPATSLSRGGMLKWVVKKISLDILE